jgi:hypothetical protein
VSLTANPALTSAPVPDEERVALMREGLEQLRCATGRDFGFDLAAWEQYLMSVSLDSGYRHPYAFAVTLAAHAGFIAPMAMFAWLDRHVLATFVRA